MLNGPGQRRAVDGTETAPTEAAEVASLLQERIKLFEPNLQYLVGADPSDPQRKALANQFLRNTWTNNLELKRKLFSMMLDVEGSVRDHIKSLTEVYDELSAIGEPVKDEDRIV